MHRTRSAPRHPFLRASGGFLPDIGPGYSPSLGRAKSSAAVPRSFRQPRNRPSKPCALATRAAGTPCILRKISYCLPSTSSALGECFLFVPFPAPDSQLAEVFGGASPRRGRAALFARGGAMLRGSFAYVAYHVNNYFCICGRLGRKFLCCITRAFFGRKYVYCFRADKGIEIHLEAFHHLQDIRQCRLDRAGFISSVQRCADAALPRRLGLAPSVDLLT